MKPAGSPLWAKDLFPIEVAGLHLRDGGMAAIGTSQRRAHAEAALGEVESVAHGAPDAVVLHPFHMGLVHTTLKDEILDQASHRIIGEGRNQRRIETEAAFQAA